MNTVLTFKNLLEIVGKKGSLTHSTYDEGLDCFSGAFVFNNSYADRYHVQVITTDSNESLTHSILAIRFEDFKDCNYYLWLNPVVLDEYRAEIDIYNEKLGIKESLPKLILLDVIEDIEGKITAAYNDEEYDRRVMIQLDLDDETKEILYSAAEASGLTIDEFFEEWLTEFIKSELRKDSE